VVAAGTPAFAVRENQSAGDYNYKEHANQNAEHAHASTIVSQGFLLL
jgi:hypothetical protein